MVDNKDNQWEETEYIEDDVLKDDVLEDDDSTEEYSDDDETSEENSEEFEEYEDGDEEYEEYEEDYDEEEQPKKKMLLPLIIILVLLLAGAGFGIMKFMGNKDDQVSNNSKFTQNAPQQNNRTENRNSEEMANDFFEQAGGEETNNMMSVNFNENSQETNVMPDENQNEGENQAQEAPIATVTETQPGEGVSESDLFDNQNADNQENDSIMVTYNKALRLNPFKPPVIARTNVIPYETINNSQFEIIEPPTATVPDENLTKLLQTQISGIMYDSQSPSAIVNLNGQDQFVKIGDVISGYKIKNITKDKVEINYKNNSYVASVGELFTRGSLEKQQTVANLENKFAGRYKKTNNN